MPLPIEDYALIGDLETSALVGRDGSIDWLCWPRFDSDACFAALLGEPGHGRWLLAAADGDARVARRYREDTLILETSFETSSGRAVVIDFMPPRDGASDLVRMVRGERGVVSMRAEYIVRFGYGAYVPWVTRSEDGSLLAVAGPDSVVLRGQVPMHPDGTRHIADFDIKEGETRSFVLTYSPSHLTVSRDREAQDLLQDTERFWREWISEANVHGPWMAHVKRSLITLRALIYAPTGGIVAAPTTSLPERLGGVRNWDYRFCWLRDATLTLLAFMNAGFYREAGAWRQWLLRAAAGNPSQMQIMYGLAGERRLSEWEAAWLPGYENAKPVRIGNQAHCQLQLDVYGELMDALHQARKGGLAPLDAGWALQRELLRYLADAWREPDYGIWEIRGPPQHFTYSKVMCWVAFDRAIRDAERYDLEAPVEQWRQIRDDIYRQVCAHGYDPQLESFVQSYGSKQLDASLLLMAPLGCLPANDPRFCGTVRAIETNLMSDGFVRRYDTAATDDGLPVGEGVFLACNFWLVDALAMCGRRDEATRLFERLLGLCNDVGLMAEQFDPASRRATGNFPQAFSHLSLIATAFNLARDDKPVEQRSERPLDDRQAAQR